MVNLVVMFILETKFKSDRFLECYLSAVIDPDGDPAITLQFYAENHKEPLTQISVILVSSSTACASSCSSATTRYGT